MTHDTKTSDDIIKHDGDYNQIVTFGEVTDPTKHDGWYEFSAGDNVPSWIATYEAEHGVTVEIKFLCDVDVTYRKDGAHVFPRILGTNEIIGIKSDRKGARVEIIGGPYILHPNENMWGTQND